MKSTKVLILLAIFSIVNCTFAQENQQDYTFHVEQLSKAFREAAAKVMPAVVYVEVTTDARGTWRDLSMGSGSGVIIDANNGYVLTASHVVQNAVRVTVKLPDGRSFEASEFLSDPKTEIALIKIDANDLPQAQLGDSDKMQVGDWVLAIGSPLGEILANSVSAGIVSGKGRTTGILLQEQGYEDFIQTDAAINRGNSGGPLVNLKGLVIGINSNIVSATGMNAGLGFAVPSNLAKRAITDLIELGRVERGYLGIMMSDLNALRRFAPDTYKKLERKEDAVYVTDIDQEGPAAEAGIKQGDLITAINGQEVEGSLELRKEIGLARPGDKIDLTVIRDGDEISLDVTLGRLETEEQGFATKLATSTQAYNTIGIIVREATVRTGGWGNMRRVSGLVIRYIKPNSLAAEFGLETGDMIVEVNGEDVTTEKQLEQALQKANLKKGIKMTILDDQGWHRVIIQKNDN